MDIAIATLEDLYEDSGGIPNSLTMPRLEDVKEDVNKITISTIKQGMAVVISTSLLDASGYIVPDMKKTSCLNGIVLAIDKVILCQYGYCLLTFLFHSKKDKMTPQ